MGVQVDSLVVTQEQFDSFALSVSRGFSQLHLKYEALEMENHKLKAKVYKLEGK